MSRTAEQITQEIANLEGELAALAGEPLQLADEHGTYERIAPETGATLTIVWAHAEGPDVTWYPTVEAAKAALAQLARQEEREPRSDGFYLNLTAPGCRESSAYVTRLNPAASDNTRDDGFMKLYVALLQMGATREEAAELAAPAGEAFGLNATVQASLIHQVRRATS